MTQLLAKTPSRKYKHKPVPVKEIVSRLNLTSISHNSILQSPYLSREAIHADAMCTKEKVLSRSMIDHESSPKSSYRVNPDKIKVNCRQTRKMKHSVLTLPPSTHPPPSCKHCHDLELCKCRCNNSDIKHRTANNHRTSNGDRLNSADSELDRNSFIDVYRTGERKSEIIDARTTEKSITSLKSPTYVISRTLTPERDLSAHDIWNILREMNAKEYARTTRQISEKRVLYDANPKARIRHIRNNELNNTFQSRRHERKNYLSDSDYRNIKENAVSNASSLEYVPVIEMYHNVPIAHGVVRVRNNNTNTCNVDYKHVNKSNNAYPTNARYGNQPITTNSTTSKETGMQTLSGRYSSTPDRKDIQREKVVSTLTRTWNQNLITPKTNITNINYEKNSQPSHKNRSTPISLNKKVNIRKISYFEVKRQLALLKYPIVVMGRDICASVRVPEYQAPQFESMPRIWQYMIGWSTNYKEDNIKPNKYFKLIEKQQEMESRCYKGLSKISNVKRQRIQKAVVRKNYIPKNIINSDINIGFEEKDFKILFQNTNNIESNIPQEIISQPQNKKRDITLVAQNTNNIFEKTKNRSNLTNTTKFNERCPSSERKTVIDIFMENLKNSERELDSSENINESKERLPVRKYCSKLTKSKEDINVKVKATLDKLETNYFYDYTNWIESTLSQSKKHPFRQSSIINNRKKTLDQPEQIEPTSKGSPREIEKFRKPECKESSTKRNTKIITRKSRNKIVQKYFMDPFLSLPASNDLTVENIGDNSTPELLHIEEVIKDIQTIIHIPGFSEKPHRIVIRTLNGNELAVEDIFKNIVVSFEVVNVLQKTTSQSDKDNLNNRNIDDMLSLNQTIIGRAFHYKASVELCCMTLPEQICSIWPLLLNKLECIDDVLPELQNNTTDIKETRNKIPREIVPKINTLDVYLRENPKNNFEMQNTGIPQLYDYSETKSILHNMQIVNFREMYHRLPHTLQTMNVMEASTSLREMGNPKTLTIKYELCSENQWNSNQFLRDYVSDEFTHLFNRSSGTKKQNSMIRLHQDNTPIMTFAIPVQVMQKFLKLISNGRFQFLCMRLRSERSNTVEMSIHEKISSAATENTVHDRRHLVKNISSSRKLKNVFSKLPGKIKNRWERNCASLENFKLPNVVKTRPNRKNTKQTISGNIKLKTVNSMKDFVKVLGASNGVLSEAINGQLAKRILTDLREYKIWSEEISPVQAILTLLLSSKPDTRSLVKFRSALVHGIATGRIRSSAELDRECLLVERDADVDYKGMEVEDGRIVQELYGIARKTASAHNRLFSEDTERTIDFLVQRKRKLNPSYMRVMAKYVGLGLFTSPAINNLKSLQN